VVYLIGLSDIDRNEQHLQAAKVLVQTISRPLKGLMVFVCQRETVTAFLCEKQSNGLANT
jgi:hypothetical protein